MKNLLTFIFLLINVLTFAQDNQDVQKEKPSHRHIGAMQFGGQTMISYHYEYSFIKKSYYLLNSNIGLGLNEHGDEETGEKPIFGIHSGLINLIGARPLYLEIGINPTTYFYKSTTFVNLNGWLGIRFYPKAINGFLIALGYTPRIYTTYSDPTNHFFNASIGVKFGINF